MQGTLDSYRRKIGRLYQTLPEGDKAIRRGTLPWWREKLAEEGCSAAGVNQNVALLVERAQDRLLEEEQLIVGWDR